jgi:hypothetical protein
MTMICSIVYAMFDETKAKKGLSGVKRGVLISWWFCPCRAL